MASHESWWSSLIGGKPDAEKQRISSYSGWTDNELGAGVQRNRLTQLSKSGSFVPWSAAQGKAAKDSADAIYNEMEARKNPGRTGLRVNQAEINAMSNRPKDKSVMRNWTDQEVDAGTTRTGNRFTDASIERRLAGRANNGTIPSQMDAQYKAAADSFTTVFDEKVRRMRNMKGK